MLSCNIKKNKHNTPTKNFTLGFSLIETVIYLALTVLFVVLVVEVTVTFSASYRRLVLARTIAQSGSISMERITRELRTAGGIDVMQSSLDVGEGRIRLFTTNESGYAQAVSFALENGVVNVYTNDLLVGPLTSSQASTTNLSFHLFDSGSSKAVSVFMTVEARRGNDIRSESFQTTVGLRNSF